MSKTNLHIALSRISVAEPNSPIAAFIGRDKYGKPCIETRFAKTVRTEWQIRNRIGHYVGTFTKLNKPRDVKTAILSALDEARSC